MRRALDSRLGEEVEKAEVDRREGIGVGVELELEARGEMTGNRK